MKRFIMLLLFAFLFTLSASPVFADDTVTITDTIQKGPDYSRGVRIITFTFSSDDGDITATTNDVGYVTGTIVGFLYVPDATNTPDAGADVAVKDSAAIDVLYSACSNVGATATRKAPKDANSLPVFLIQETIYLYVTDLGTGTNAGVLTLYIQLP